MRKSNPKQLAIMMSMESVGYYECFNDPAFMSEFDFEMTYRLDVRTVHTPAQENASPCGASRNPYSCWPAGLATCMHDHPCPPPDMQTI